MYFFFGFIFPSRRASFSTVINFRRVEEINTENYNLKLKKILSIRRCIRNHYIFGNKRTLTSPNKAPKNMVAMAKIR